MSDRGDNNGRLIWMRIRRAICELQAPGTGPLHLILPHPAAVILAILTAAPTAVPERHVAVPPSSTTLRGLRFRRRRRCISDAWRLLRLLHRRIHRPRRRAGSTCCRDEAGCSSR